MIRRLLWLLLLLAATPPLLLLLSNLLIWESLPRRIFLPVTLEAREYRLTDDLEVWRYGSLRAVPGTTIVAEPRAAIEVEGSLVFEGSAEQPVVLKAARPEAGWTGIEVLDARGPIVLSEVTLSHCRDGVDSENTEVTLKNVTVAETRRALYIKGGMVRAEGCRLLAQKNPPQESINVVELRNCGFDFQGCLVESPDPCLKADAFDIQRCRGGLIKNNLISGCTVPDSDAIDLGWASTEVRIEGNLIIDCIDKGVSVGQRSSALVSGNVFVNCGKGIGAIEGSRVESTENTFVSVGTALWTDVGEKCPGGGSIRASNSIFSRCESFKRVGSDSSVQIVNSVFDSGSLEGEGNQRVSLEFRAPERHDYRVENLGSGLGAGQRARRLDP